MKTMAKILSLVLAVIMVAASFSSCGADKKLTAGDYLDKMLENSAGNAADYKTCLEEIIIDPSVFLGEGSGFGDVSLKLLTNSSNEVVFSANAGANGANTDLTIYYSGNSIVASSSIFDSAYGMSFDDLKNLTSNFGGESEDETVDSVSNIASLITTAITANAEQFGKTVSKYIELIADSVDSAADQKVELGSNTITVSVNFNSDSAKKAIKDVYNTLKKDKEVRKLVESIAQTAMPEGYEMILEQYDNIFANDDMLETLFAAMNEHLFEVGFTVTSDKDYQIKGFGISFKYNEYKGSFSIDATNENDIVIKLNADVEEVNVDAQVNVKTVVNGNDKNVSADLTIKTAGESMTVNVFSIDLKESGEFTIAVSSDMAYLFGGEALVEGAVGENLVEITGTFKEEGKSTELTIADITNVVGETVTLNITVKTTYDVEFPKFPAEFVLVSELGEEDFAEIMNAVATDPVISFVIEMIGSMNEGSYGEF